MARGSHAGGCYQKAGKGQVHGAGHPQALFQKVFHDVAEYKKENTTKISVSSYLAGALQRGNSLCALQRTYLFASQAKAGLHQVPHQLKTSVWIRCEVIP